MRSCFLVLSFLSRSTTSLLPIKICVFYMLYSNNIIFKKNLWSQSSFTSSFPHCHAIIQWWFWFSTFFLLINYFYFSSFRLFYLRTSCHLQIHSFFLRVFCNILNFDFSIAMSLMHAYAVMTLLICPLFFPSSYSPPSFHIVFFFLNSAYSIFLYLCSILDRVKTSWVTIFHCAQKHVLGW